MPLKTYETRDEIPDAQRESAIERKDGKWIVEEAVDTTKLSTALDKERQRAKDEKAAREAVERERDELKAAKEATEKGVTREALDKINADAEKKFAPIVEENAALKAKLRKATLTDRLEARALKAGIMPDRVQKAIKDLDGRVDLTEDGEDFVVKDAKGNVTAEPLDEFLAKTYKAEAPFFYSGPGGSGSGAQGSDGGNGSGYDPAAAGKKAGERQKQVNADASLALK
jgi:hypothetical protein